MKDAGLQVRYQKSWALVIGINDYEELGALAHAVNDAKAVAKTLIESFSFPEENVEILLNEQATLDAIRTSYLRLADQTEPDDRVLVFFAGHGTTRRGTRGDVGYLVPVGGDIEKIETLLRWDELTRSADQIEAKHMLFVMDACYGGLAVTRGTAGTTRYLRDLLQRRARQVLTAGKEDELVSDGDGPRPGHSIFTGHFLEALDGGAANQEGIINAQRVMTYVAEHVGQDDRSFQTPHFGHVDGDGDFIFDYTKVVGDLEKGPEAERIIIESPPLASPKHEVTLSDTVKEYLSDRRHRIALNDLAVEEVQRFEPTVRTNDDSVPIPNAETLQKKLNEYELAVRPLQELITLISRWGTEEHRPLLRMIMERSAEMEYKPGIVNPGARALRWYPLLTCLYSGGMAAIHGGDYGNFKALVEPVVADPMNPRNSVGLMSEIMRALTQLHEVFKLFSSHERHYVPCSEFLFEGLQPSINDTLFVGRSYEDLFERCEVLLALVFADQKSDKHGYWFPTGRYSWKIRERLIDIDPLSLLTDEATEYRDEWPPLKAGLMGGSFERFIDLAQALREFTEGLHRF